MRSSEVPAPRPARRRPTPRDDRNGGVPVVGTNHYGRAIVDYMEKKGMSWAAWCFDPDWGPTLVQDWSFTPTEQGRLWKAALLGQPLPPE